MSLADCLVKISFDDPASASTFTDVSAYVRSVETNRGAASELENVEAGTCVVTLDNRDRRFDPTHASGPYYPDLSPMKAMLVQGSFGGDTQTLFYGFIESITQTWNGLDAVAEIRAVDVFKLLALEVLPDREDYPAVVERILQPWGYWRLNTKATTKIVPGGRARVGPKGSKKYVRRPPRKVREMSAAAGPVALVIGSPTFELSAGTGSNAGPVAGEYTSAMSFPGTTAYLRVPITDGDERPGNPGNAIALSCLIYFTSSTFNGANIISGPDFGGAGGAWRLSIPDTGGGARKFRLVVEHSDGTSTTCTGTTTVTTSTWYHIFACWRGNTGVGQLFVNGVREAVTTSGAKTMRRGTAGNPANIARDPVVALTLNNAYLSDVVISEQPFANDASLPEAIELYRAARLGGLGSPADTPDADNRGTEIITGAAGYVPDVFDSAATGMNSNGSLEADGIAPQRFDGSSRLEMLRRVEEAEGGFMYAYRASPVVYLNSRDYSPSITYTFGDSTGELPYIDIAGMDYSDEPLFNIVRVKPENGTTQVQEDSTSISTYLARVLDLTDTLNNSDAEADELATFLLAKYKDPGVRVRDITIAGHADDDLWPPILNLELGDRITIKRRPPGGGSAIDLDVRILGIAHSVEGRTWTTRYSVSPSP